MTITTLSSREFSQDASKAKRAALRGPVFITDRGRPAHVLLTIEDYRAITGQSANIVDLLSPDEDDVVDFTPPRLKDGIFRPADLG